MPLKVNFLVVEEKRRIQRKVGDVNAVRKPFQVQVAFVPVLVVNIFTSSILY